jgi:hypothetical protein
MEGTGIQSFVAFRAQKPLFAKTGITPWQSALKGTTVCHNRNNPLAIRSQILNLGCGDPRYEYFLLGNPQSKYRVSF